MIAARLTTIGGGGNLIASSQIPILCDLRTIIIVNIIIIINIIIHIITVITIMIIITITIYIIIIIITKTLLMNKIAPAILSLKQ